jgi:hypothetical protein
MQRYKYPTSVAFDTKTVAELRRRAARETLRSGRPTTVSGLVRRMVERALAGEGGGEEPEAATAVAGR